MAVHFRLCIFVILVAASLAAAPCAAPAPRNPEGNLLLPGVMGDIPYKGDLTLDAYAPKGDPRPAAIIIHGARGDKATHIVRLFEPLANAGYAWFSVDYKNQDDLKQAVSYIRCPGRFNITKDAMVIGEETGAQAALELAAGGGFTSAVAIATTLGAPEPKPAVPVLMIHGGADRQTPPDPLQAYCRGLKNCKFHLVPNGNHNLENWHVDQREWKEEFAAFARRDRRGLWRDIAFAHPGGFDLLMDGYIPEGKGPFPTVIIAHGGGWEGGDKVTYISPILPPLAKAGFAWFSIDYRLTPYVKNPEQLEDLRDAIRYVRKNAARYHVDPQRIAIMGESASGQMVAQVASEPCEGCDVQAVVSFYGVYDFTARAGAQQEKLFGPSPTPETVHRYSPIFFAHPKMPPVLLLQGTGEGLYPGTVSYEKKLTEVGVRHDMLLLKDAPHGMENWEGHPEWAHYKARVVDWLKATLR